ncbi:retrovirus-related pol polyprotein from transposon TNT 1-94 [Tanacetum coccineum]
MKEGASVVDHVNEFISILSWLMSVDIKFDVEVQAFLLLFSLPESWSGTVTAVSGSTEEDKCRGRKQDIGQKQNIDQNQRRVCLKPVTSRDKKVNMAARDYDDALVCCIENTIDDHIMDSGASFHATYCKEEIERFKLRFGLKKRLISVGQLDEEGYHVPSDEINVTIDVKGNAALWHQRLGHMSEKGIKVLASKGRIPDLQKVVVGFCEPCVLGKQKKVSFLKSENTRKLQRFKLVHIDIYGPTSVAAIGISRYYVIFIDDNNMKAALENETNLRVTCLKSDNGAEYSNQEFIEYCAEKGIRMLITVLEPPQQNDVSERMNRTLNERAKSMRLHVGLLKMIQDDPITTAAYLINRGSFMLLGFRIPKGEWQGMEVSLAHLRVFRCDSYVKVKDVARDNLDAKSVKCTFIGYGSDKMGYRFWDSKGHKVVRSRDVTFNEDSLCGAKAATYSSNLTKPDQKDQVVKAQIQVRGLKTVGALRIVEVQIKKTLKTKHPLRRKALRLHRYEDPPESPGLQLPAGKKALQSKWVFRVKEEHDSRKRYMARLVVKGFQQKRRVDYNEIFSPVVKMTTISKLRHGRDQEAQEIVEAIGMV